MEVDRLMVYATIAALRAGRYLGVNDNGLLEDWIAKLEEDKIFKGENEK